jgi:hypothetical protein
VIKLLFFEEIDFITNTDISLLSSEEKIESCLDNIFSFPHFFFGAHNLYPGYYVIRVRPDFMFNDIIDIKELSYKPKHLNDSYQRASTPNDTMLYCSSCERRGPMPFTDIEHGLITSLYETVKELQDGSSSEFSRSITYSIWVVKEPLVLARVALYKNYHFPDFSFFITDELNAYYSHHDLYLSLNNIEQRSEIIGYIDKFYYFLSNLFSSIPVYNKQYIISALASKSLCYKHGFNGISYPSVRKNGEGLNFAFPPHVVDEGLIYCVELGSFQLFYGNEKLYLNNLTTHYKFEKNGISNDLSLLEKSIQNNKLNKKEIIQYLF